MIKIGDKVNVIYNKDGFNINKTGIVKDFLFKENKTKLNMGNIFLVSIDGFFNTLALEERFLSKY